MKKNIHQTILDEIKKINKSKPAQQCDLINNLDIEHDKLVAALNDLYANGKMIAEGAIPNNGKNKDYSAIRFLEFRGLTTKS